MTVPDQVGQLTFGQLKDVAGGLRGLLDKLDAVLAGDDDAWTAQDALVGHQLMVLAQSHVNGVRTMRAAARRTRTVVSLEDRR